MKARIIVVCLEIGADAGGHRHGNLLQNERIPPIARREPSRNRGGSALAAKAVLLAALYNNILEHRRYPLYWW
jgi:hypothetical protein